MKRSLSAFLPSETESDLLDAFLRGVSERGISLYEAQEEALLSLFGGDNVILNTPTGSGKSLVAEALHFHAMSRKEVSYYTCPIKALVNEKFLNLCKEFGAQNVGMMTGDATVNGDAPIICCTAEILSNRALREGAKLNVKHVVMDEFHYYSDRERGIAWQIPLLELKNTRFLLMSATLGEMDFFAKELTRLNGKQTAVVTSATRPVPLEFTYRENPLHETLDELLKVNRAPVYIVCFTQASAAETAQSLLSVDFCDKEHKAKIAAELQEIKFSSPYGKDVQRLLKHGVGIHHAGLLPKYRVLVEKLAQKGLLKIICGTDTLGVGVNVPIRTVLLTQLCKYDGEKTAILSSRDFHQITGRAGRKGFDDQGFVVALAPEHVIENKKIEEKIKADPKKAKKLVKRSPPSRGYVHWDQTTFEKLIKSQPEPLVSKFNVSHSLVLNVLSRKDKPCESLKSLINNSHETDSLKRTHRLKAFKLFRSLLDRKLLEIEGESLRVNVDLQEDFSLNHALSLYLLDTLKHLDPTSGTFALDLLTLVESIIENPDIILRRQLDRVKTIAMSEMKAAGMEYEERMEELEKLEHPKPLRDFIYSTFNEFSEKHPWVGTDNIRPKSVAREMFENYFSFAEYIKEYDLQRGEGLLLRYLSEVTKVLLQTVPDAAKTEAVDDVSEYFIGMLKAIDSSLLDEWLRLQGKPAVEAFDHEAALKLRATEAAEKARALRQMTVQIRNAVFSFVRAVSLNDVDQARTILPFKVGTAEETKAFESALRAYFEVHGRIRTDFSARAAENTIIDKESEPGYWIVSQRLVDTNDLNDAVLEFEFDQAATFESGEMVLRFREMKC